MPLRWQTSIETPAGFWEIPVEAPVHTIYCGLLKQPDKQERTRFPEWSRLAYFRWKGRRSLAECGGSNDHGAGTFVAAGQRGIRSGGGALSDGEHQRMRESAHQLLFGASSGGNRGLHQGARCVRRGLVAG